MLAYEGAETAQRLRVRAGRITDGNGLSAQMPAVAPTPRLEFEARALRQLLIAGAEVPVLVVPLSTRREVLSELAELVLDPRQQRLIPLEKTPRGRLILPDV